MSSAALASGFAGTRHVGLRFGFSEDLSEISAQLGDFCLTTLVAYNS